ncbi:MAG: hypothetical protein QGF21_08260 [Vicinamibacterales bacterium]|jgi:general secretion pathway protein G|nr:hypothetical protein [Acidobacteriota bacterium]MDP7471640.1 hypothetical protein [Vicinamibacterales bacterium]MDP7671922.1 hypothetical protein [Vicinamibacterales bacterium]HJO37592.1 hypothetical protein [Vicinamibacterales bacterium]|tara:strand:+ start:312 stop:731 length:420 start_codon:yes stop_codon:yes gene_type:complete
MTASWWRGRCRSGAGGWTLVELLIVISLITLLAGISLASYRTAVVRSREAVLKEDLFRMRDAIDQYFADKSVYPPALDSLVADGYIRQVPEDPFTGSPATWQTVLAEPDFDNPTATLGVFDVKSGAEGMALDGTPYAEW